MVYRLERPLLSQYFKSFYPLYDLASKDDALDLFEFEFQVNNFRWRLMLFLHQKTKLQRNLNVLN